MSTKKGKDQIMAKKSAVKKSNAEVIETVAPNVVVVERVRPPVDDKGRYREVDMSMEELDNALKALPGKGTKSKTIRYLASQNYSPTAISKFMGVIYQHVRNVLNQELKRPTTPTTTTEVPTEAPMDTADTDGEADEPEGGDTTE